MADHEAQEGRSGHGHMALGSKYRLKKFEEILDLDTVLRKSGPIQRRVIGFPRQTHPTPVELIQLHEFAVYTISTASGQLDRRRPAS